MNFSIIPVTVVIRRKDLVSIGGFQKDQYYPFADIPTFLKLALKGKFSYQDDILGYYRKQSNSEWFNFASNTSAMGRKEVQKCVNNFLLSKNNRPIVKQILRGENHLLSNQKKFIKKKQKMKKLSLFLNRLSFKEVEINPLSFLFPLEYALYRLKRILRNS